MHLGPLQLLSFSTALAVLSLSVTPQTIFAQGHVVPMHELYTEMQAAGASRAENLKSVNRVLAHPKAQEALGKYGLNQDHVRKAISTLSDEELSRLAGLTRAAERDLEGGFIIGFLALIGLIVLIIIVVAVVT